MNDHQIDLLELIKAIRESFTDSKKVYTQGSCVRFCLILKTVFNHGTILYDMDHAIFELDGRCFDINGIATKNEHHSPLKDYDILLLNKILQLKA